MRHRLPPPRRALRGVRALGALLAALVASAAAAQSHPSAEAPAGLPRSSLAVRVGDEWRPLWRSDRAPVRWSAPHPAVTEALRWRRTADGVELAELSLAGNGEAWRLTVVVVRLDPVRTRLRVALRQRGDAGVWTIDSAPPRALVAMNGGQFLGASPWGWVVDRGRLHYTPGRGPLSSAMVQDSSGLFAWREAEGLLPSGGERAPSRRGIETAIQSYPTLLREDGVVPPMLRARNRFIDVGHRDARLAVGVDADGHLLLALTRFGALGEFLDAAPFGPTVPEMAALMGALGARRAMMLDGGLSAQLLVRDGATTRRWPGLRKVPLGLWVEAR